MTEYTNFILKLLNEKGPLTTKEIERFATKVGKECIDGVGKTLILLKMKGIIKGKIDPDNGTWVWWVEDY